MVAGTKNTKFYLDKCMSRKTDTKQNRKSPVTADTSLITHCTDFLDNSNPSYFRLSSLFSVNPKLCHDGKRFVETITMLLEKLLDYRTVLASDDSIDNRMSCIVNLLVSSELDPARSQQLLHWYNVAYRSCY